ncbi:MAG: hypothetical protein M3P27_02085 [Acidobacteriota bacterium]|nr:hypothetical protein [Acidobacteriota bacterium]
MNREGPNTGMTRRRLLGLLSGAAAGFPLLGATMFACGDGAGNRNPGPPAPNVSDEQLLDEIERAAFQFFWTEASSVTGMVKDRALANGGDTRTLSSIAATGFGLTALCIGAQRGYAAAAAIKARVLATLQALLNQVPQQNGWFYHFLDMNTGQRSGTSEVSPIDSSILLCGVLTARQFYAQDPQIAGLATQIYNRVDFPWMLNGGNAYALAWTPENGFMPQRWDTYSEMMMLYLLGIGSPTHPAPVQTWDAFTRPTFTFQNITYITNTSAPLFIHQYSHAWFDFRNQRDAYANYFQNSMLATQAHKAFCLSLSGEFSGYVTNLWGISASDSKNGYVVWGGPPRIGPVDGTVVPCAAAGSVPFLTSDCLAVLRNIRFNFTAQAWRKYGFVDAFNPLADWSAPDVIGIDLGITMLMAENARTGFVWQTFMANPEVRAAMAAVNFQPA